MSNENKILYISCRTLQKDGQYVYSKQIREMLSESGDLTCFFLPGADVRLVGKFYRILKMLFLICPVWFVSFDALFSLIRFLKSQNNIKHKYVVIDFFSVWWSIFLVKRYLPNAKYIAVSHNIDSSNRLSYVRYSGSLLHTVLALIEFPFIYVWEIILSRQFQHIICISKKDKTFFDKRKGEKYVSVVYPIINIGDGKLNPKDKLVRDEKNIVLVGSYTYKAKELNALWLMGDIMPNVYKAVPNVKLYVVGYGITEKMKQSAAKHGYINIVGSVPSLDRYYDLADLAVVPERIGGGFKLKITEAVSNNVFLVLHKEAQVSELINGKDCFVADSNDEFVKAVIKSLNLPLGDLAAMKESAKQRLVYYHSYGYNLKVLKDALNETLSITQ